MYMPITAAPMDMHICICMCMGLVAALSRPKALQMVQSCAPDARRLDAVRYRGLVAA